MKKTLLSLGIFLLSLSFTYAQNYFILNKTGTGSDYNMNTTTGATVLLTSATSGTLNDVLTDVTIIPFNFTYYGQTYTTFKASDNGYLTFDVASTTSVGANTTLPNASAPKNSIFAFWQDLQMASITQGANTFPAQISTWTVGTAPNRQQVIQWRVASPNGSTNAFVYVYFAIRLYEKGYFDIIHDYGAGTYAATVGCTNADGSMATMANGSPNINVSWSSGNPAASASKIFEFHYPVNINDASLYGASLNLANNGVISRGGVDNVIKGDKLSFSGNVYNFGSATINSYDLSYSIDGNPEVTKHISTPIASGSNTTIAVDPWTVDGEGQIHTVDFWITNVNGTKDDDSTNNSFSSQFFVLTGTNAPAKPLIEEGTGAWCGYCPDGHRIMEQIVANNPNAVSVVYHNQDFMSTSEGNSHNNTFLSGTFVGGPYGYPFATVNRTIYPDNNPDVSMNRDKWLTAFNEANTYPSAPIKLDILTKTYDWTARKISFTVTITTTDYIYGDLRINALVKEDKVRGPDIRASWTGTNYTNSWTQHNYYSSQFQGGVGGPSHPLYGEDEWMVGYLHNAVVEKVLTGTSGQSLGTGIIAPGTKYTQTFTWTMPAATTVTYTGTTTSTLRDMSNGDGQFKPYDVKLVAFATVYSSKRDNNNVLNATEAPLLGWSSGIINSEDNATGISLYPNPTTGNTTLSYMLYKSSDVAINIYNALGEKVKSLQNGTQAEGLHTLNFDVNEFNNGMYFVTMTNNGIQTTKEFMVQK